MTPVTIIGSGWLGMALASRMGVEPLARRSFVPADVTPGSTVFVASGRSAIHTKTDGSFASVLHAELVHLRKVLDASERAKARRVVVLGSSDVAGLAERVRGASPQAPLTPYARVKTALEDECRLRSKAGLPITSVRLAPVHGPGKVRSSALVRLARQPLVPLPGGGHHSIGFVFLDDALAALIRVSQEACPDVVSIGGGHTPLRVLLSELARAQGAALRWLPVPLHRAALRLTAQLPLPDSLHWLVRLSLPKEVVMETPVPVTPLPEVASALVSS